MSLGGGSQGVLQMAAAVPGGFGAPLLVQAEIDPGKPSTPICATQTPRTSSAHPRQSQAGALAQAPGLVAEPRRGCHTGGTATLGQNQRRSEFPVLGRGRLAGVDPALS